MVKEAKSPDGLLVRVSHHHNPYSYLLDDDELDAVLLELGLRRAASIWRNHTATEASAPRGVYGRACMAFVLMDPTADPWVPDDQAVMAAVVIGDDGAAFLPNAGAKAAGHRRLARHGKLRRRRRRTPSRLGAERRCRRRGCPPTASPDPCTPRLGRLDFQPTDFR